MDKKPIISVSLVVSVLSSLAEAAHANPVDIRSSYIDPSLEGDIKRVFATKPVRDSLRSNIGSMVNGLTLDGRPIQMDPRAQQLLAQNDDSTSGAATCYTNCFSACYGACHSTRGWR